MKRKKFATNHDLELSEVARLAPGRPHTSTVWRWARRGVKSRSGRVVKLGHVRAGGRVFSSAIALEQFFRELAEADAEHFDRGEMPTGPRREAEIAAAERKCEEVGI